MEERQILACCLLALLLCLHSKSFLPVRHSYSTPPSSSGPYELGKEGEATVVLVEEKHITISETAGTTKEFYTREKMLVGDGRSRVEEEDRYRLPVQQPLSPDFSPAPLSLSQPPLHFPPHPPSFRPLVGILTQPGDADSAVVRIRYNATEENIFANLSYVAASYVKFVEAGGARPVPIIYNEPKERMDRKLRLLNGLLLPGGHAKKGGKFLRTVRKLLDFALRANDRGDYFPVFAECLGFETLLMIISGEGIRILEEFNATKPSPLIFTGEWVRQANMFQWTDSDLENRMMTQNLAMENHKYGISPARFQSSQKLSDFFNVLTTSFDDEGREYVSMLEAKRYPISAIQWHPEKNAFEGGNPDFPHSSTAVKITVAAAGFFGSEVRKSFPKLARRRTVNNFLMYNYHPIFTGREGFGHYDQVYVFQCNADALITRCYLPPLDPFFSPSQLSSSPSPSLSPPSYDGFSDEDQNGRSNLSEQSH